MGEISSLEQHHRCIRTALPFAPCSSLLGENCYGVLPLSRSLHVWSFDPCAWRIREHNHCLHADVCFRLCLPVAWERACDLHLWVDVFFYLSKQQLRLGFKHRVQLESSRALQTWNRGSWVWQSTPCLQVDMLVQSICFVTVVHSFTHVRSSIQDNTANGARLQHEGGQLVTYKFPEGRTTRVIFHACVVQKPIMSLGCIAQQRYWSDLCADIGTLFFLDKIQTKHSQTQLHKEESLFFVKGMLIAPFSTAGVSDEVAQE